MDDFRKHSWLVLANALVLIGLPCLKSINCFFLIVDHITIIVHFVIFIINCDITLVCGIYRELRWLIMNRQRALVILHSHLLLVLEQLILAHSCSRLGLPVRVQQVSRTALIHIVNVVRADSGTSRFTAWILRLEVASRSNLSMVLADLSDARFEDFLLDWYESLLWIVLTWVD